MIQKFQKVIIINHLNHFLQTILSEVNNCKSINYQSDSPEKQRADNENFDRKKIFNSPQQNRRQKWLLCVTQWARILKRSCVTKAYASRNHKILFDTFFWVLAWRNVAGQSKISLNTYIFLITGYTCLLTHSTIWLLLPYTKIYFHIYILLFFQWTIYLHVIILYFLARSFLHLQPETAHCLVPITVLLLSFFGILFIIPSSYLAHIWICCCCCFLLPLRYFRCRFCNLFFLCVRSTYLILLFGRF